MEDRDARTGPTWRGLAIAVLAAVVLSVAATALLGGLFSGRTPEVGRVGWPCCPPAGN